jgi:hypothetical protein
VKKIWIVLFMMSSCINTGLAFSEEGLSARDIVLSTLSGAKTGYDGISVTVLVMDANGNYSQRAPDQPFYDGDKFRIKITSTTDGMLSITNINPQGTSKPLFNQPVSRGVEVTIPADPSSVFSFVGVKGLETLSLLVTPNSTIDNGGPASKDIRLVTQNTAESGYLARPAGSGPISSTLTIRHQ